MTGTGILVLLQGGAIMSWLYACVSFTTLGFTGQTLPFTYSLACFALAALVTRFSSRWALRNYAVLVLHLASFTVVLAISVHHVSYPFHGILSATWVRAVWGHHPGRELAQLILLACSVAAYWVAGRSLGRAKMGHNDVCSRFDIGLAVFFCLFLFELTIPGGSEIRGTSAMYSLFSFLLLSILSIGVSLSASGASRHYYSRHGLAGAVTSLLATIVLFAISAMLFFLPAFERAAHFSYQVFGSGASVIGTGLVNMVKFLARLRRVPPPLPPQGDPGSIHYSAAPTTWLGRVLWHATRWGLEAGVVLAAAAIAFLLAFLIVRWLLKRAGTAAGNTGDPGGRASWLSLLGRFLLSLCAFIRRRPAKRPDARLLYRRLLRWGARGGLVCRAADTPAQFSQRLSASYPDTGEKISSIVDPFVRAVYGDIPPEEAELACASSALRALKSPRYWPRRLKTRFTVRRIRD
jgi:hypothetical protein